MGMFEGALTALVTPFRNDAVDERALRDLVEKQIADGIDGLVPAGTTGESVNLSHDEYVQVVRITVDQAKGRVPVVAGAGTASTRHTLELTHAARDAKADGVLIATPYYNRPTQEGLYQHYKAIAGAGLPVILYNIPPRSAVDLSVQTIARLSELPQIVAIKESTGNVLRSAELVAMFGDRFTVLSGDDSLTVPVMSVGGKGVISVVSNVVPGDVARCVRLFREGDLSGSLALAQRLRPLIEACFLESSPGPVKYALAVLGRAAAEIRLPLVLPTEATQARMRAVLGELNVT